MIGLNHNLLFRNKTQKKLLISFIGAQSICIICQSSTKDVTTSKNLKICTHANIKMASQFKRQNIANPLFKNRIYNKVLRLYSLPTQGKV